MEALANLVDWEWDDNFKKIDEVSIDHVWEMMKKGFIAGELCRLNEKDEEICGWWKIKEVA